MITGILTIAGGILLAKFVGDRIRDYNYLRDIEERSRRDHPQVEVEKCEAAEPIEPEDRQILLLIAVLLGLLCYWFQKYWYVPY